MTALKLVLRKAPTGPTLFAPDPVYSDESLFTQSEHSKAASSLRGVIEEMARRAKEAMPRQGDKRPWLAAIRVMLLKAAALSQFTPASLSAIKATVAAIHFL